METATVIDCARIWEHGRVVERDIHNAGESAVSGCRAECLLSYLNFKMIPACKTTYRTRRVLMFPQPCNRNTPDFLYVNVASLGNWFSMFRRHVVAVYIVNLKR